MPPSVREREIEGVLLVEGSIILQGQSNLILIHKSELP